ncbi:LysR family transcriptional regulator [Roseibium sp. SCP14]|uniref:LysR family transcriptional regulator n=1 Tax=Roseibium sp. SCP14 TaxID=3141375 RepID=UPI0033371586
MQLKQLEVFDAIVRSGSISAAAREMGMTQSAVSKILARFEEDLGYEVFYRQNGKLVPAPRASSVLGRVRKVLEAMSSLRAVRDDSGEKAQKVLSLVTVPSLAHAVIPTVLKQFNELHPETRVLFDVRTTHATIDTMIRQAADFALVTLPVSHPTLSVQPLYRSTSHCCIPETHPLAEKERISAEDLIDEPLVLLSTRQPTRQQIDEAFRRNGIRPNVKIETANVLAACRCAEQGLGIAIVNALMAGYTGSSRVAIRPFGSEIFHTLALLEGAGLDRKPEVDSFLKCLHSSVEHMCETTGLNVETLSYS